LAIKSDSGEVEGMSAFAQVAINRTYYFVFFLLCSCEAYEWGS